MGTFEYNPLADAVMVSYLCPKCNNKNNEFIAVPSPDLTAETARESANTDTVDIQCEHCGEEFRIELGTSYNAGWGIMHGVEKTIVLEEDFPFVENND
jgi:DNA-directed RNA polymerase subunit RPC12/RpoP